MFMTVKTINDIAQIGTPICPISVGHQSDLHIAITSIERIIFYPSYIKN